jgi:hypothetical protein
MSESDTALHDEEVFSDELPDAVLEVAGSKCWEGPASSVTIGFCSGPETCPMRPALGSQVAQRRWGALTISANSEWQRKKTLPS